MAEPKEVMQEISETYQDGKFWGFCGFNNEFDDWVINEYEAHTSNRCPS